MTDLTGARSMIQTEETQFRYAISESLLQKVGKSINFINSYQYSEKQFNAHGCYALATMPQTMVDGIAWFKYDAEIVDVVMWVDTCGTSGTTELDLKKSSDGGATWATIMSTTPKIAYNAGNMRYVHIGASGTGLTAPVLTSANLSASDALRMDIIQAQSGNPYSTGLLVLYRPR